MPFEPVPLSLSHLVAAPRQVPTPGEKPPLLVLFHGVGSNERDLIGLAPFLDPRLLVVSVRGPYTIGPGAYAWYHIEWSADGTPTGDAAEGAASRTAILKFLPEVVAAYDSDPARTYIGGFSQGAIMSLYVALTEPSAIAGAVLMSGRLAPQAWNERVPDSDLVGLPIFAAHGLRDRVLPIRDGREIRDQLATLPVALTYREYDMAHEVSGDSLADAATFIAGLLDAAPRMIDSGTAR